MKSSRNNRLKASWTCSHCGEEITVNRFRLSADHPGCIVCPRQDCARPFPWTAPFIEPLLFYVRPLPSRQMHLQMSKSRCLPRRASAPRGSSAIAHSPVLVSILPRFKAVACQPKGQAVRDRNIPKSRNQRPSPKLFSNSFCECARPAGIARSRAAS